MKNRCFLPLLPLLLFLFGLAYATEDLQEVFLDDIVPRSAVFILLPGDNVSYESGQQLTVKAEGINVDRLEAELVIGESRYSFDSTGDTFEHVFRFESPPTEAGQLTIRGFSNGECTCSAGKRILSPKEELIERMIALARANSKDKKYKFAPAETDTDIGVCKNFVMRLFDTFSAEYRMAAYPGLKLHMPKNNSKANCAPYDYGIEWRIESAEDGSPFEIAAQFKYNNELSEEENAVLARELVEQIQKGDFFQIVGYYGGGNGPHSMFIISGYDPETEEIHWTDSNMRGKRIDGVRWGYLQFDASNTADWWVRVFNMKKRGATLYRLRDDLYKY